MGLMLFNCQLLVHPLARCVLIKNNWKFYNNDIILMILSADDKQSEKEQEKVANFQLDAAQRKKLPIWIRHGLEKMEKEKLKKVGHYYYC